MTYKLTKKEVLTELEDIGLFLNRKANPKSYSFKGNEKAEPFKKPLQATRYAYKAILEDEDFLFVLESILSFLSGEDKEDLISLIKKL